jgi:hypothetical protein
MHLYLREDPRALILVALPNDERLGYSSRVLVFKPPETKTSGQAVVEFLHKNEIDLDDVVRLTNRSVHGCLGLLNIGSGMKYSQGTRKQTHFSTRQTYSSQLSRLLPFLGTFDLPQRYPRMSQGFKKFSSFASITRRSTISPQSTTRWPVPLSLTVSTSTENYTPYRLPQRLPEAYLSILVYL